MTTGRPGTAHLGLPFDVQKHPVDESEIWADAALGRYPARRTGPDPEAVEHAAEVVLSGRQPVVICGGGVVISGAEAELRALAELIEAPVATTVRGQGRNATPAERRVGTEGARTCR